MIKIPSKAMWFLSRLISYNFYKRFGFLKVLPIILTLSVNDWCNLRCKTCNIWKNDPEEKKKEELRLEEYEKIFSNYGKTYWITITGGEPLLRRDLVEIVKTVYQRTRPEWMTIATNGSLSGRIINFTKRILDSCQDLNLIINLSLDGIGKQHDEIRGVKGSFKNVVNTFKKLKKFRSEKLVVGINTVISKYNVKKFDQIYTYVKNKLNPDSFVVEIAENRARLYNLGMDIAPEKWEYRNALKVLINGLKWQGEGATSELINRMRKEFYRFLLNGKPLENFEGIASGYIMANGEVWLSDSRSFIVGNIKDVGYDFKRLWFSEKAQKFRRAMEKNYITLAANAFYTNFICNAKMLSKFLESFIF